MPDASELPSQPILRPSPEGHTAPIIRIAVDAGERWLVSGSIDKTVKVWRLADGVLARTLRMPQGPGDLGKVYAVALSPDGSRVAAGGWTGSNRPGHAAIHVFDRATGELMQRIPGLPNVINHLAYSPDGQRLAATLHRGNGIRVYKVPEYEEIARDEDYGSQSYWAAFAPDGRLATTGLDGKLRLCGPDLTLLKTVKARGGRRPFAIAFSPDGERLAVGYDDTMAVDVLDGTTLRHLYSADTRGVDNGNLFPSPGPRTGCWRRAITPSRAGAPSASGPRPATAPSTSRGWRGTRSWTCAPSRTEGSRWGRQTASPCWTLKARSSGRGPWPPPTSGARSTTGDCGSPPAGTASPSPLSRTANAPPSSPWASSP